MRQDAPRRERAWRSGDTPPTVLQAYSCEAIHTRLPQLAFALPLDQPACNFAMPAIRSARGLSARLACLRHMLRWCNWHEKQLWEDLIRAD